METNRQKIVQDRVAHTFRVEHQADDEWKIATESTVTDDEAAGLTFRAEPRQVRLGAFVTVHDAEGVRIGRVSSATYHERLTGPAYVVCAITLR